MSDVQVTIGASLKELTQGLNQAGALVDGFKKEAMKAREVATFLGNAISGIGAASGQAAALASNLIGGFAAGGAMGLAIGGVNALVGVFKEVQEAEKKATESLKTYGAELRGIAATVASIRAELAGDALGAAQITADAKAMKAQEGVQEAIKKRNEIREKRNSYGSVLGVGPSYAEYEAAEKAVEVAIAHVREVAIENEKAMTDARKAQAEKRTQVIEKEQADAAAALQKNKEADKAVMDRLKARMDQEREEAEERGQILLKEQELQQKAAQKEKELQKAIQDARNAADDKVFEENYEKEQQALKDRAKLYSEWGQRIGSSLANAITSGMSPLRALGALLKDAVKAVLQAAITTITAKAGEAAAGAASSQAGIPIVGPALAAGAMAAMLSMVMGLVDGLPSASGGWETPSFGTSFPAVLHPNEVVIPAWGKAALKNMANIENGGSMTNITITAIDGPSVDRIARDHSSSFRRALRLDARRRRA